MARQQDTKKRRVAAAARAERQQAAASRRDRRRRLVVGGVVGFLALALIAPLTAGLIADDDPEPEPIPTTTLPPLPPWVPDELAGATLTGPTPCPADDGTAERTTGFTTPPPICIADDDAFELRFATAAGEITMPIDATADLEAANLAAVFARYRTYEGVTVEAVADSLLFVGGGDDTGFTIPVAAPAAEVEDPYPVGSVVAVGDIDGIDGSLIVVLDTTGSVLLAGSGPHVVVGTIDDLEPLRELSSSPAFAGVVRVDGVRLEPVA